MTYRLPSLKGLRAFEAAARHSSFKHAATELCVTPGAVSQQVKALETAMGVALFRRLPRGLILTEAGEEYLLPISDAFRRISRATDAVSATLKGRVFRLGISEDLSPEVHAFVSELKDGKTGGVLVVVTIADDLDLLFQGELDAVLRAQATSHPGLHQDQLRFQSALGDHQAAALVMVPGIAGCREHELLLKAVRAD